MNYLPHELAETQLAEIDSSPIRGSIESGEWGATYYQAKLPHIGVFYAEHEDSEEDGRAFLHFIQAPELLRGNGIATRLMGGLAYMLIENDYTNLVTSVDSPHSVRIFRTLFGEENITFYDLPALADNSIVLPITADQAIASISGIDRGWSFQEHDDQDFSLGVEVDLSRIDPQAFEVPVFGES